MQWKKLKRFSPHQLRIDWGAAGAASAPKESSSPQVTPAASPNPQLIQVLPWDFVDSFPEPLEDAVEAGALSPEDASPENVGAMHGEYARQLLGVLAEQDRLADARHRGVDPKTQAKPVSKGGKERLKRYFETEPAQLERHWNSLMAAYEAAFGENAAIAFGKAICARHAGIKVVGSAGGSAVEAPGEPGSLSSLAGVGTGSDDRRSDPGHEPTRRVIARLPVPRPLRHAVAAGHFGHDENGPVHPSPDEVRDITVNHAEEIIDLLEALYDAERRGTKEAERKERSERVDAEVAKYAEDFGKRAAAQLLAYCRRQSTLGDSSPAKRSR